MIKNYSLFEKWEGDWQKKSPPNYLENLKIFESLYSEAIELKVFPLKDPMEGIQEKIQIIKRWNVSGNH